MRAPTRPPAGCVDVSVYFTPRKPDAAEVSLLKYAQIDALRTAQRQIDAHTTGPQARKILGDLVAELEHDLDLLTDGDRELVAVLAHELGFRTLSGEGVS